MKKMEATMASLRLIVLSLVMSVFGGQGVLAQGGEFSKFFQHDEASNLSFRYQELDLILDRTVMISGPSERYRVREKREKSTGSNLAGGSSQSKTWLEGNRVLYDVYDDDGLRAITQVRQTIEALPFNYPIETWSRDEQLAFWLNLYTIGVYEIVAHKYPVQKLKRLRQGKGSKSGTWDEKRFSVAGVPLSLNDIQFRIVMPQWKDPRILYGFYQGTIGGPSIQSRAFMGRNVWRMLDRIGLDFVNSMRGVDKRGRTAHVSLIYDWGKDLFPDFETDLRAHLASYADDKTQRILKNTKKIKAEFYDWVIADLHRGRPRALGTAMLTSGAHLLNTGGDQAASQRGSANAPDTGNLGGLFSFRTGGATSNAADGGLLPLPQTQIPPHTRKYLEALDAKFRKFGFPNTRIEIREIERERGDAANDIPVVPQAESPSGETVDKGKVEDGGMPSD